MLFFWVFYFTSSRRHTSEKSLGPAVARLAPGMAQYMGAVLHFAE
jgi:hypothetical protein